MNNENVIRFPANTNMDAESALASALEHAEGGYLTDVLVIGYYADGTLFIRSSKMSRAEALWMVEKARAYTLAPEP